MATNLSIDPDLLRRALEVSGERTKKAAVTKALQEFIARRRQKCLLELVGKLEWDGSYDYKMARRGMRRGGPRVTLDSLERDLAKRSKR
jgi:Arc/MetJ family transcription regulator